LPSEREELSTTRSKLEVEKRQLQQTINASRAAFKRTYAYSLSLKLYLSRLKCNRVLRMHAVYAEGKVIVSAMGNAAATQKELEHIAQEISTIKDRVQTNTTQRTRPFSALTLLRLG
jgi:hypothetical protein